MNLAVLPNLGPRSQQMLAAVGIDTLQRLRELGAVRAYLRVKRNGGNASLNLLWALEGALTGQHWQVVAKQERLRLLMELEALESADTTLSVAGA
jgi:DNA transformation protein